MKKILIFLLLFVPAYAYCQGNVKPIKTTKGEYVKITRRTSFRYNSANYLNRNMRMTSDDAGVVFEIMDDSNRVLISYMGKPYVYSETINFTAGDSIRKSEVNPIVLGEDKTLPDEIIVYSLRLRKEGFYIEYYLNGQIKIKGNYKEGFRTGTWIYYDEKNQIIKKEWYKNDKVKKNKIYK